MQTTTHYALQKPDDNDTYNKHTDNSNMDTIDAQLWTNAQAGIPYAIDTSVTANTITASITPAPSAYTDGYSVRIKVANTTNGATTLNLNGLGAVAVNKSDGTPVGSGDLVAGVPAIFTYAAGTTPAFIASGSGGGLSGTGNATAADVRGPKTFTSSAGKAQTGTLVDNGNGTTHTPTTTDQSIAAGIWGTANTVKGDANLLKANIKAGINLFNVAGTFTADATATAAQMLSAATAYVNGQKITGTIPQVAGGNTITPGTAAQTAIAAGTYAQSAITVAGDANLVTGNIKAGSTIFGVAGKASVVDTADANAPNYYIYPGYTGYVNGSKVTGTMPKTAGNPRYVPGTSDAQYGWGVWDQGGQGFIVAGDGNLTAGNIRSGASIFGVAGNLSPRLYAQGQTTIVSNPTGNGSNTYGVNISGLAFAPRTILVYTPYGYGSTTANATPEWALYCVDMDSYYGVGAGGGWWETASIFTNTSNGNYGKDYTTFWVVGSSNFACCLTTLSGAVGKTAYWICYG